MAAMSLDSLTWVFGLPAELDMQPLDVRDCGRRVFFPDPDLESSPSPSAGSTIASAFKGGIVAMVPDWCEPGVGQGSGVRETVANVQVFENRSEGPPIMREL